MYGNSLESLDHALNNGFVINLVVERDYNGMSFKFREDGYFNMTHAAKHFGKDLQVFMRRDDAIEYVEELSNVVSHTELKVVHSQAGRYGGTWAHPKLAVFFARWLDVKFAVFCDMVIDDLIHGHSVITVVAPEKAVAPKLPSTYLESLQELVESLKEQDRLKIELEQRLFFLGRKPPKVEFIDRERYMRNHHLNHI